MWLAATLAIGFVADMQRLHCVSHLHFVDRVSEEPVQTNAMHAKMYSEDTEVKKMTMDMFVKSKQKSLHATKEAQA